jgi:hypothetical protein
LFHYHHQNSLPRIERYPRSCRGIQHALLLRVLSMRMNPLRRQLLNLMPLPALLLHVLSMRMNPLRRQLLNLMPLPSGQLRRP